MSVCKNVSKFELGSDFFVFLDTTAMPRYHLLPEESDSDYQFIIPDGSGGGGGSSCSGNEQLPTWKTYCK